ncbi:MAG: translocation/assembly module TamB domain-containing protein [Sterolibacteriaceae bacterium]|nr:translocation/assembly module TamB domain-containing protein [Candidatus Methylophosphatis haderslevensis]
MPDPATPPENKPAAPPQPRRSPRLALLAAIVLPATLLLGMLWLLASEAGLGALATLAGRLSGNALVIDGAQGRLLGPLRFAEVRFDGADTRIRARDIALDWRFGISPERRLILPQIGIGALDLSLRPSDTPPALPADLALPLALQIDRLQIDRLRLQGWLAQSAAPAPSLIEIDNIAARLQSDGRHHQLTELRLSTPFGSLNGKATLDGTKPFTLEATLRAEGEREAKHYVMDATAHGPLDALAVNARASGWNLAGEADLAVTPFSAVPLHRARVRVGEIDPAAFSPGAPRAALQIVADLTPRIVEPGTAKPGAGPLDAWVLAGPIEVFNREPGPFDRGALPFARLNANALWRQGRLALDDVVLVSSGREPGRLTGTASLDTGSDPTVRLQFAVSALDPREWVSSLKPARLGGEISAVASIAEQTLQARLRETGARSIVRAGPPWQADLALRHKDGVLDFSRLQLAAGDALLDAAGKLQLGGNQSFDISGKLARFDPGLYAEVPHARLTADLSAHGVLKPQLGAALRFDMHDSQLATREGMRALVGKGELQIEPGRLVNADVALDLAGNRLTANGAFGRTGDLLKFVVDAQKLDALGMGVSGRLEAAGQIGGTLSQPSGEVRASAAALRLPDLLLVDAATLIAQLRDGPGGRFEAALTASGLRKAAAQPALAERVALDISGTRGNHKLQGSARLGGEDALDFAASGGLLDGLAWKGTVERLALERSGHRLALSAPAPLMLAATQAAFGPAELRTTTGRLRLGEARWSPDGWSSRGELDGLQVGIALDAQQQANTKGRTLTLGGNWDLRAAAHLDGTLTLFREAGDLSLGGDTPVSLGLRELQLKLVAQQDRVNATLDATGEQLGQLNARAALALERDGHLWKVARAAPLEGDARFAMPSLAWIGPLIGPNVQIGGALGGNFTLGGSLARPDARGSVRAAGVHLALVEHGLRLSDGEIDVDLTHERAKLARFDFRADPRVKPRDVRVGYAELAGTPGRLTGSGEIELAGGKGSIVLTADRLAVLQRADRWLMMSGEARLTTAWDALALAGKLRADAGYIEFAAAPPPALGDDVVVLGRGQKAARTFRLDMDLEVDLGRSLYFKGRGLDARLAGEARLRADGRGPLRATGSIRTRGGTYDAYGQFLTIERGIINFQGPIENAGLNVLAVRSGLPVEAGVEITGTMLTPRVRLVSEPSVPDAEKLSWIVLGRGQEQAGGTDSALLLSAASAILGDKAGGISRQLAQSLGLDQISVTSGDIDGGGSRLSGSTVAGSTSGTRDAGLSSQIVSVGKRLSADAFLSYEQSLAGAASVVKLTYNLSRRLSVIGRAGTDNSVDLHYSISFP